MKDFILNLYGNDNFTLYLTIALVVLVVLFLVVLFFGKKDKKLQETQKLQKVTDTFKEEKTEEKVEVAKNEIKEEPDVSKEQAKLETKMEKTQVLPVLETEAKIESIPEPKEEVKEKVIEPEMPQEKKKENFDFSNIKEPNYDEINNSLEKELTELENLKKEINSLEIPEVEKKPEEKEELKKEKTPASQQVFSSVFVNKPAVDDFELPTLKEEVKEEKKKEPVDENNEIKAFSFDDISGETYNLENK